MLLSPLQPENACQIICLTILTRLCALQMVAVVVELSPNDTIWIFSPIPHNIRDFAALLKALLGQQNELLVARKSWIWLRAEGCGRL